jgi:hypothetical protein
LALPLLMTASPAFPRSARLPHRGAWPIQHGHDIQPTAKQLRAMHVQDVTQREARRVNELYWELQSMRTYGSESCNSFVIPPRERARCRASLARHPYVLPSDSDLIPPVRGP